MLWEEPRHSGGEMSQCYVGCILSASSLLPPSPVPLPPTYGETEVQRVSTGLRSHS
jgi:hypothetical protein